MASLGHITGRTLPHPFPGFAPLHTPHLARSVEVNPRPSYGGAAVAVIDRDGFDYVTPQPPVTSSGLALDFSDSLNSQYFFLLYAW
jgi:hypothetical protein